MTRTTRRIVSVFVATVLGAASAGLLGAPAHAANKGFALSRGEYLLRNDYIQRTIASGIVRLRLQGDGNLVLALYSVQTGAQTKVCWGAATKPNGNKAIYQEDGNFVVYSTSGGAIWASNTAGGAGETVDMNANGRLYVGKTPITGNCTL
jgi:hypothetical protein